MTVDDLLAQIDQGTVAPVYFLYGSESFYQTEILAALKKTLIDPENRDFNFETYHAKTSAPGDWIGAANTLSFMGGTKLVIVRDLHETSLAEKEAALVLDYAADPLKESCLVLTAAKADRKKKFYKTLTAYPWAVSCEPPREAALIPWIRNRAKALGYSLPPDAARTLVDRIGAKPGMLATELEKAALFAGAKKSITQEDVLAVVGDIRMENAFALTEALKTGNAGQALGVLRNLLDHGEDPIKILGMIVWQLRTLWEVKHYQSGKMPTEKIAQQMGAKPFVVEKAMRHTGKFSQARLKMSFAELAKADRALKTSGGDPEGILKTLLINLQRNPAA